jgi:hypothetical protein
MKTQVAFPGARAVDSLPFSMGGTMSQAATLRDSGIHCLIGYLGAMTPKILAIVLAAGLAFMPVTFAGEYKDGAADEIAQLKALNIPAGTTVWLDLEGINAWNTPADELSTLIESWGKAIVGAGYMAGIYVGAPQPLTGKQLYALKYITRYWLGIGRCVGKDGLDAYPQCGWCVRQDWHNNPDLAQHKLNGGMLWPPVSHYPLLPMSDRTFVDTNGIQADHQGRLPTWVVA